MSGQVHMAEQVPPPYRPVGITCPACIKAYIPAPPSPQPDLSLIGGLEGGPTWGQVDDTWLRRRGLRWEWYRDGRRGTAWTRSKALRDARTVRTAD